MIHATIRIQNLDQLRSNFAKAPSMALRWLSKAVAASIFEVEKQAIDPNFRFKTPRARRTGFLALSFAFGRHIAPGGLQGSIGPTAQYAPHVYFGTSRGIAPNPFMDRIAEAAEPTIGKHFEAAVDGFVSELAKV